MSAINMNRIRRNLPNSEDEPPSKVIKTKDGLYEILYNDFLSLNITSLNNLIVANAWHKFTFTCSNDRYTFNDLLQEFLDCNVIPVCLKEKNYSGSFYVNNNGLNDIWRKSAGVIQTTKITFKVNTPFDPDLNVHKMLINVLRKRFNLKTGFLNLSDFIHDPEFLGLIYLPLSDVQCLDKLFHWMKDHFFYLNSVESIDLSRNKIKDLTRAVRTEKCINLDLSSNMIPTMEPLRKLYSTKINELNLDNNPLCALYEDGWSYLREIKDICPTITKLDGVQISEWNKTFQFCQHSCFTVNENAHHIVDLFLSTFFTIYDSSNREKLLEYYGESSLFSLTSDFDVTSLIKSGIKNSELMKYTNVHRNIMKLSNMANYHRKGYKGANHIMKIFGSLPPTDHDPLSFSVDVIQHEDSLTTVVVMGVFRHNQNAVFRFTRTFILKTVSFYKFLIMNELLHVRCATDDDTKQCFKEPLRMKGELNLINPTDDEEEKLMSVFSHLSGLLRLYSRRRLVDSNWDLKEALQCYVEDLKKNDVPDICYRSKIQV